MKKSFFIAFFLIVGYNLGFTQSKVNCDNWSKNLSKIISLEEQLHYCNTTLATVDTNCKIEIYNKIAEIYSDNVKEDSTIYYFDKASQLAKKQKEKELLADSYSRKANFLITLQKTEEAKLLLEQAKELLNQYPKSKKRIGYYTAMASLSNYESNYLDAIKYNDSNIAIAKYNTLENVIPDSYHNIGLYYFELSDYEKAAKNLLLSVKLKEKSKENDIGNTYYILGCCYERWEQYDTAIKYFNKAIAHSNEQKNYNVSMRTYIRLSKSNRNLKLYDDAKKAIDSAINLAKKIDLKDQYAEAITEKGWLYLQNYKDTLKAEKIFLDGHQAALISNNQSTLFFNLQSLLLLYYAKKEFKKAEPYLDIFERAATACNTLGHTREKHNFFYKYYEGIGDYKEAFSHLKDSYKIKDSINNVAIQTKVADLEKKYDTQKKELEIINLEKEKAAQNVLIEKAEFKQGVFLFLALLLITLLLIGYWIFRKIKLQNEALAIAQKQLKLSNEKLIDLNTVKNRLFSIIAHDLRSMLIPFQRSGKLLKYFIDHNEEDNAIKIANELEKNSNNLSNMLDNLLSWSLNQMNGYSHNPVILSVKSELQEILDGYEQQAIYKQTKLELKFEKDAKVKFDKGAFHVIFRNLIGNALKYTEKGSIRISFEKDFDSLKFYIVDTGVGMTKEQIEKVFQLEKNKTTIGTQGEKGTGIGLNLVYRFVKMNHGTIVVSSEKRIGTQFELTFLISESKEIKQNNESVIKSA